MHAGGGELGRGEAQADVSLDSLELDLEKPAAPHDGAECAGLNLTVGPQAGTGYEPANLGSGDQHAPEDDTGDVSRNAQPMKWNVCGPRPGIVKAEARRPWRVRLPRPSTGRSSSCACGTFSAAAIFWTTLDARVLAERGEPPTHSRSRRFLDRAIRRRSRSSSAIRTRTASVTPLDVFDSGGRPGVARCRLNAARTSLARG
jgi:hypothetical protein